LASILVVEDNDRSARLISLALHGHTVARASTAASAYRKLDQLAKSLDIIIVDRHLSRAGNTLDASGEEVLEYALDHYPGICRIMITAAPKAGDVDEVKNQFKLVALLVKTEQGYGAPGLRRAVERALLAATDVNQAAVAESFSLLIERLEENYKTQKVGLDREIRAAEREHAPGWRATVAALRSALTDLDKQYSAMRADADETRQLLFSLGDQEEARQVVERFSSRWDAG